MTADINCPGAFTVDVVQWMVPDGNEINKNPICLRKHSEGKKGKSVSPFSGKKFTVERALPRRGNQGPLFAPSSNQSQLNSIPRYKNLARDSPTSASSSKQK